MEKEKNEILLVVRKQLAQDMGCAPEDFLKDGVVFCEAGLNSRRGIVRMENSHLEIVTMGRGIVASGQSDVLNRVRPILSGKRRDDLFSAPFLYGHSLYYIPDRQDREMLPCPEGFSLELAEGEQIRRLYAVPGFENALRYEWNHPRPDVIALYATRDGEIAGMAAASQDCEAMWQIGIDVMEKFRGLGLAAFLVNRLARLILEKGVVPFYGTASSNIPSQAVAHRSGFAPAWMCNFRYALDGKSPYRDQVDICF